MISYSWHKVWVLYLHLLVTFHKFWVRLVIGSSSGMKLPALNSGLTFYKFVPIGTGDTSGGNTTPNDPNCWRLEDIDYISKATIWVSIFLLRFCSFNGYCFSFCIGTSYIKTTWCTQIRTHNIFMSFYKWGRCANGCANEILIPLAMITTGCVMSSICP